MTVVVISQPMFFPWVGLLEQVRLADVFVHYDDVQFSKGSFTNRAQVKTAEGMRWLTLPLSGLSLGQAIREVRLSASRDWRGEHLALLRRAYAGAPCADDMLGLVESVYAAADDGLGDLAIRGLLAVADYFGLARRTRFVHSSELGIAGKSSQRVLDIVRHLGGTRYVTGHGARHYLDHALFERNGVAVEYMDYRCNPYPQMHGAFTPHVSILDLIANTGRDGVAFINSATRPWRDFLARH